MSNQIDFSFFWSFGATRLCFHDKSEHIPHAILRRQEDDDLEDEDDEDEEDDDDGEGGDDDEDDDDDDDGEVNDWIDECFASFDGDMHHSAGCILPLVHEEKSPHWTSLAFMRTSDTFASPFLLYERRRRHNIEKLEFSQTTFLQ